MRRFASALLLLMAATLPVGAAESVYSKLDLDRCDILDQYEEGGGFDARCRGIDGYPVYVSEGDARMSVSFGEPGKTFGTFGPFNSLGKTVEWRMFNGEPHAAIIRYHLETGSEPNEKGDALVVYKVARSGDAGCPMAAIDVSTTEQPNGVARGVAAFAPRFDCERSAIIISGPEGLGRSFNPAVPEGR
ncbi:hypothetical protein [Notoacmeibacter sp. MSK16QG-6]|uniref:hypothetical protein n=1 Tax=Notoacmeibacter sp. MSK16QG-6 TaxID=2957982 RepID=UPI0020A18544|nr:hypothetical protein [Notoacmeibacter sp. MSK16QG-6]MCP1199187.1 hypothetical protein [Notoacmeibacter sp. MSK16QG-6]